MPAAASARRAVVLADEHDRYHRQSLISWWDQLRLRDARVLVVGAGALGNELVKNLVLVGVGHVLVSDLDAIEHSNLSRCVFFRPGDEGRPKADVLVERAAELNPDVTLTSLVGDVRARAGIGLFAAVDVVLGGLDSREARLFVNQACWKASTPFVDGAIEGLMGSARVFVPPDGACYECTMSERDHELVAARRTCALLSREDVLEGKVPTTATTASVIAGVQVQEAIKLLHAERLGPSALEGAAFQFVGLTHDSYVVRYSRRAACLSHDTYGLETARPVAPDTTLRALLADAVEQLGGEALLELEHELVLGGACLACGREERIMRPAFALTTGAGRCPGCGEPWRLAYAHAVEHGSPLLDCRVRDLGLPEADVIVARTAHERRFYVIGGEDPVARLEAARG